MANAAKRMKEKKQRQHLAILKSKGLLQEDLNVVEETTKDIIDIDAGTVTGIDIVTGEFTEEELNEKYKDELIEIAETLGVDATGSKKNLIKAILG